MALEIYDRRGYAMEGGGQGKIWNGEQVDDKDGDYTIQVWYLEISKKSLAYATFYNQIPGG